MHIVPSMSLECSHLTYLNILSTAIVFWIFICYCYLPCSFLIHWLLRSFQVLHPVGSCWSITALFFSNEHISWVSVNARTMPLSIIFVVLVSSYCLHQWVVTHISICILHSYWYPPLCPLCTCSYVCLKIWLVCTFCAFVALLYNVPHFTMVLWA